MGRRRQVVRLIGMAVLAASGPGCQSLYSYRPVPVLVRDAETKQPIAGATAAMTYLYASSNAAPWDSSGKTGGDGIARLRGAAYGDGATIDVSAAGYMSEQKDLSAGAIEKIEPAHFPESAEGRPAAVVVALYAEPRPSVELVVPPGFRGVIKADLIIEDDTSFPAGQRRFTFEVPPSGEVAVTGSPLLGRVFAPDFTVRFADGAPVSRNGAESDTGFWWLKHENGTHYFVVGTRFDYDTLRRAYESEGPHVGRPVGDKAGGKGGGRRGGGRRGGGEGGMGGGQPPQ